MKEIQEKRLQNELQCLQEEKTEEIEIKIHKDNKEEYHIYITIPKLLSLEDIDIDLLLLIQKNYPFNPPKLYFKSIFIFPHLCDGRDMIEDVLSTNWKTQFRLIDILEKIPKFIMEYSNSLKQGYLLLIGNYYLGDNYDLNFIENLPIYSQRVKERVVINGKPTEIQKLLVISDLYFCMFEIDKKIKGNALLTFWSNIRALITIKRIANDNLCRLVWRNNLENQKSFELSIIAINGEEIQNVILGKIKNFGINYNVSQRTLSPKTGELPPTDIYLVENQIEEVEKEVQAKPTMELLKFLMTLYENAVEFYSAINNPRYEYFTKKIQEILKIPEMLDIISQDPQKDALNSKNEIDLPKKEVKSDKLSRPQNKITVDDKQHNSNETSQTKEVSNGNDKVNCNNNSNQTSTEQKDLPTVMKVSLKEDHQPLPLQKINSVSGSQVEVLPSLDNVEIKKNDIIKKEQSNQVQLSNMEDDIPINISSDEEDNQD